MPSGLWGARRYLQLVNRMVSQRGVAGRRLQHQEAFTLARILVFARIGLGPTAALPLTGIGANSISSGSRPKLAPLELPR